MIFQISIELELTDKDVHAVIDFDTGLIGFSEKINKEEIEYSYFNAPVEFRVALLDQLEPLAAKNLRLNGGISRKSEVANVLRSRSK